MEEGKPEEISGLGVPVDLAAVHVANARRLGGAMAGRNAKAVLSELSIVHQKMLGSYLGVSVVSEEPYYSRVHTCLPLADLLPDPPISEPQD